MVIFWGLFMALPLLGLGGALAFCPGKSRELGLKFQASRLAAGILTWGAWLWTAYELDMIGIDVFDRLLKLFPGQLYLMAAVLAYLTFVWMAPSLSVRALMAILMLFPASLFRVTRLLVPASGFAAVHILVSSGYIAAVIGMYGMFYPWRYEKLFGIVISRPVVARAIGAGLVIWGAAILVAAFCA